ncbi:MAG TPA: threonine synthase [Hadesarchaea archaeon]|nr:threonine synthase [Hadesarchaea archaeon]
MRNVTGLQCRECGESYPKRLIHACGLCFGPLDVAYDYAAIAKEVSKESIACGPPTLWRYRKLLPIERDECIIDIGVGFTPLLKADNLARELKLKNIHVKNDSVNPTFSFKDRPSSVAVSKAIEFGSPAVGAASTGNLSGAMAAHAAKARLPCFIFIPEKLEMSKVAQTLAYGAHVIEVTGTYDQANRLATEIALTSNIAFANINVRPYYVEGSKTLVFEVCEQLGWRAPDHIIVPVASGALLHAAWRGLKELEEVGLIDKWDTRITAAQAEGCSPVVQALLKGENEITPVEKPDTTCKSLAIGDPADGYYAIQAVRATKGTGQAPDDKQILDGIKLLAKTEGVFTEPAGGTAVAALKQLVEDGEVERDEEVVLYITGNGLKTQESITPALAKPFKIKPTLEDFKQLVAELQTPGVNWLEGV